MADLKQQSENDLAAAARMLVDQVSTIHQELVKRGIDCDLSSYDSGRATVEYTRITKEKIA